MWEYLQKNTDKLKVLQQDEFALILPNEIHFNTSVDDSHPCIVVFAASFMPSISKAIDDRRADQIGFKCSDTVLLVVVHMQLVKFVPEACGGCMPIVLKKFDEIVFTFKSCLFSNLLNRIVCVK